MIVMDLLALAAAIQKSALLTGAERAYWSARLSHMTETQLERLGRLLKQAENLHWTKRAMDYVASLTSTPRLAHA